MCKKKFARLFMRHKFWSRFSEHSTTHLKNNFELFRKPSQLCRKYKTNKEKKNIYQCTTCWKNFKHYIGLISNSAMRLKIMIQFISNHSIHNTTFLLIIFFQVFKFSICKVFLLLRFLAGPFSLKQWLSRQDRKKTERDIF